MLGSVLGQNVLCFLSNAFDVIGLAALSAHVSSQHCSSFEYHFSASEAVTTVTAACGFSSALLIAHVHGQHYSPVEKHFSGSEAVTTVTAACGFGCALSVGHIRGRHCSPVEQHFSTSGTITKATATWGLELQNLLLCRVRAAQCG